MNAVIYANSLKQVQCCTKYAKAKGYQVIALKNSSHDIIGENKMDVLLFATSAESDRSDEDYFLIERLSYWYNVELVICN